MKVKDKKNCCGCNACVLICPHTCITLNEDSEGFYYPQTQSSMCTGCWLCEDVCPIAKKVPLPADRLPSPSALAVWNRDQNVRLQSSSGGVFSELAEKMFELDGYVAGAVYKEDHTVCHIVTRDKSRLDDIRRSKYLQCHTGGLYADIKHLLEDGKQVLVCGTPCQIRGLYSFIGKDNTNLITCDFVCRGVNSPRVFLKYLDDLERRYRAKVIKVDFRSKVYGWHQSALWIDFSGGKSCVTLHQQDPFMREFVSNAVFLRPCCYECRFREFPRQSDITLGDFWGIETIDPATDDERGVSLVLLNSQKGADFFKTCSEKINVKEFSLALAAANNPSLTQPLPYPSRRADFFHDMDRMTFAKLSGKYFPVPPKPSLYKRIQKGIKTPVRKMRRFLGLRKG